VNICPISLVLATLQYRQNIPKLGAQHQGRPRSLAVIVVGLISILEILHPGIDCDDFSTMTPDQSQADPKATVDGTLRHDTDEKARNRRYRSSREISSVPVISSLLNLKFAPPIVRVSIA
jgi:hypothetical protein